MATYRPGITSAALGGLLRLAQEEKDTQPHRVPPSAQVESPVRAQVQAPITAPESAGSGKVVALKPELTPGVELPSPVAGTASGGVVAPIPDVVSAGIASADIGNASSNNMPQSVSGGPSIMGAATVTPPRLPTSLLPSAVRVSSQTNRAQAGTTPMVNAKVPVGASDVGNAKFQQLQTPLQNILGGIGKYGTQITTKFKAPQLLPGGLFKKLQDIMAPTVQRLLPNFNYNKA